MGKILECLTEREETFIKEQKVFFVATAPVSNQHHVNVSPKAPGTSVIVLDSHTVAYCDLIGSGSETAAHVLQNERMTMMFCNLEKGLPKILRLYGSAKLYTTKEDIDPTIFRKFPTHLRTHIGFRAVFLLKINRIQTSCGFSLPIMEFKKSRTTLDEYTERQGTDGMKLYCIKKNSFSIDGLPSVALEKNKNCTIVPKPEDGFIYGEVIEDVGSAAGENESRLKQHNITATTTTNSLLQSHPKYNPLILISLGVLIFIAGFISGAAFISRYPSLFSYSDRLSEL